MQNTQYCQTCRWGEGKPLTCGGGAFVARKGGTDCHDYVENSEAVKRLRLEKDKQDVAKRLIAAYESEEGLFFSINEEDYTFLPHLDSIVLVNITGDMLKEESRYPTLDKAVEAILTMVF
jgi:hypothetical protein